MTPEQQTLAQMVRAKYPGAYDDLSDRDLEQAVKSKFPGVYDDIPVTAETPQAKPFNPPRMSAMREDTPRFTKEQVKTASKHLPMAGAIIGTAMSGGAAAPAIAYAAGGAGVGQAVKDAQWNMPASQRLTNAVKSAGGAAITQGIGSALQALAPSVAQSAKNMWQGAAKVSKPVARTTQTALHGGSIPASMDEIAETVLEQGAGTIGVKNLDKMRGVLEGLDDQVDEIIKNSKGFVHRNDIERALIDKANQIGYGTLGKAKEQAAIQKALDEIKNLPARMTVQKAQSVKRSIYEARKYVADSTDVAEAMADKTMGKAYRQSIAREEPAVRPLNDQLSKQIPATKAMEEAATRTGKNSAVGLSTMLAGVVTNPLTVANALLNHPKVASFTAQRIYDVAKMLPKANRNVPSIIRALQLFGKGED